MVCGNITAVCGWQQLLDANMVSAAFTMFDSALAGWTIAILFFVYEGVLLYKTQNVTLGFITGLIFLSLYGASSIVIGKSLWVMISLLAIEFMGILYLWFAK